MVLQADRRHWVAPPTPVQHSIYRHQHSVQESRNPQPPNRRAPQFTMSSWFPSTSLSPYILAGGRRCFDFRLVLTAPFLCIFFSNIRREMLSMQPEPLHTHNTVSFPLSYSFSNHYLSFPTCLFSFHHCLLSSSLQPPHLPPSYLHLLFFFQSLFILFLHFLLVPIIFFSHASFFALYQLLFLLH